jgi:hypothetical protein
MKTGNEDNKQKGLGDLRDRLRSIQKPGVLFPCDSYSTKELPPELEAFTMKNKNSKRGLKEFGKDGSVALGKEIEKIHTRKVAKPVESSKLSKVQKLASLRYLMFMSKKQCGKIKARSCADVRNQGETTTKEEAPPHSRNRISYVISHHRCNGRARRGYSGHPRGFLAGRY